MEKNKTKRVSGLARPAFRSKLITYVLAAGFFGVSALLVQAEVAGSLYEGLLIPMCCYIMMAVSLNLTVGILGELSLGHAGFMCVGAYVGAVFSIVTRTAIPSAWIRFPLALLLGGLTAALFGVVIGIPILRLRGDYLAIVTLAFGEIIRKLVENLYIAVDANGLHFSFAKAIDPLSMDLATKKDILNGPMAVSGIPRDTTLLLAVLFVMLTLFVVMNLIDSRSGRAIMAIRDNRIAAEATGISITKHKLIVFTVSAFFAGLAGVLYAHSSTLKSTQFDYNLSIQILVFVVLGGIGSTRGAMIATVILYALPELLRFLQDYRMLVYAIVLIVMMLLNNNARFHQLKQTLFQRKAKEETT